MQPLNSNKLFSQISKQHMGRVCYTEYHISCGKQNCEAKLNVSVLKQNSNTHKGQKNKNKKQQLIFIGQHKISANVWDKLLFEINGLTVE